MLVIGDREVAAEGICPRRRDGVQMELMSVRDFAVLLEKECRESTKGRVGLNII
jgi:threonyl-tRNA synthetase